MKGKREVILNGNDAVAYAAMDSGVNFFSHYPGSPVTTIESSFKKLKKEYDLPVQINDAQNEHIAALSAMGASFAHAKSLLVMKHVGLNIAADPLVYSGYSGVKGGMVVIVGTDPGANSSTGEQDVHWYVKMFNFPLFEPTNVQRIYDQVLEAYDISQKFEIPIFIFIPVELAHTVATIQRKFKNNNTSTNFYFSKNRKKYINVGQRAVANHKILIEKINQISKMGKMGKTFFNADARLGVVVRGLAFGYVMEAVLKLNIQNEIALLQVDRVFPINSQEIIDFSNGKKELVFVEDQDGFLEMIVKATCFNDLNCSIRGKDIFPAHDALSSDSVFEYFANKFNKTFTKSNFFGLEVEERLGTFCEGCPHTASYFSISDALDGVDFVLGGDIGCSSLPPFKADWLLCMNAGLGIAQGIAMVSDQLVVSTGGDGSFFHGGMLSLQSAVENKIDLIHIVFDNQYVAMTGHQYSPSQGQGFKISRFLEAIGVENYQVVDVFEKNAMRDAIQKEIGKKGVRVIWAQGACALVTHAKRGDAPFEYKIEINNDLCGSCNLCYEKLACPAIVRDVNELLFSDENLCIRCGVCKNICPNEAITFGELLCK